MEARMGRNPEGGSMHSTTARRRNAGTLKYMQCHFWMDDDFYSDGLSGPLYCSASATILESTFSEVARPSILFNTSR